MDELVRGDRIYLSDEDRAERLYLVMRRVSPPQGSEDEIRYVLTPIHGGATRTVGLREWLERVRSGRGRVETFPRSDT